jgi:hypothetical protein
MSGMVQSFCIVLLNCFSQRGHFCGRAPEHILIFNRVLAPQSCHCLCTTVMHHASRRAKKNTAARVTSGKCAAFYSRLIFGAGDKDERELKVCLPRCSHSVDRDTCHLHRFQDSTPLTSAGTLHNNTYKTCAGL